MLNEINMVSNNILEQDVTKIMTQTNYTKEEATNKLILFNYDYIKVIKDYMNIPEKKTETNLLCDINSSIRIRTMASTNYYISIV